MTTLIIGISLAALVILGLTLWRQIAAKKRADRIYEKYGHSPTAENIVNRVIWQGEKEGELLDSLGQPRSVTEAAGVKIWRYSYGRSVMLRDGVVTEWHG